MNASGGAAVSAAEDGNFSYRDNITRGGSRGRGGGRGRDGGGQRNASGYQRWVPSESRPSSSAAARLSSKSQEIPSNSGGAADESSSSSVTNGATSLPDAGQTSSTSKNSRASGKVHSIDRRPNNDGHDRMAKDTSLKGSQVGTIHSRGERVVHKDGAAAATSNSFVPYLPQDDAIVAGLGEQEGGVDASQTQEVTDLLNEHLSALLCLPPRQFWKKVATDESLSVFLDSYLQFRRRWFDNPLGRPNVSVVAGDGDLSRRVFMVLFRMSSNHDPGTSASETLSAKEHAAILLEKKLLDIPKLLDISAIYGHDNHELTQRLVRNVFKVQPGYTGELAAYIPLLLERIYTMHQRCFIAIEALTNPNDKSVKAVAFSGLRTEFLEVVEFLSDVVITLRAFVKAYPTAAKVCVSSGNPISGQGLFLPALATVHDTLLPILQKGFAAFHSSAEDQQQPQSTEIPSKQEGSDVDAEDRLRKLSARLVELVWKLLELLYLEEPSTEDSTTGAVSGNAFEDGVWKGDSLVQAVVSLGPSDNDDNSLDVELGSSLYRLVSTGALLQSVERFHGLSFHILQACQRGTVVLDDAQQDYLAALLAANRPSKEGLQNALVVSTESFPLLTLPDKEVEEETVIQQSKISQIKDLFPEYGDGFVAACLEVYDNDPEKVIERILEGTLHPDLLSLDTALMIRPDEVAQPVKDKGKGKVSEQTRSSKGKNAWEERSSVSGQTTSSKGKSIMEERSPVSEQTTSSKGKSIMEERSPVSEQTTSSKGKSIREEMTSAKESGSSSSLVGYSGASSGYTEGSLREDPIVNPGSNLGRYVRRHKDESSFSELLDSRTENENRDVRAALRAAAEEMEYEDEYDDSFDELGGYVADAGGNEETETLADQVVRRGRGPAEGVGLRNPISGRPVVLTPWGSSLGTGRGNPLGGRTASSRPHKSAPVVPEVDGQYQHAVAKGRGNSGGGPQRASYEPHKSTPAVPYVEGQYHQTATKGRVNAGAAERGSSQPQKSAPVVPVVDESQEQDTATTAGQGQVGRGGRGRKKWKEQGPKPEFYLKDGKLYSYKVAGAVGVASLEEAEAIKQEEAQTIYGLGAGGNVPLPQQDVENSRSGKGGAPGEYGRQQPGEGGRGRGASGRGRGAPGRGSHGRRDDNHHRKDQASKKHFAGLGGL